MLCIQLSHTNNRSYEYCFEDLPAVPGKEQESTVAVYDAVKCQKANQDKQIAPTHLALSHRYLGNKVAKLLSYVINGH